MSSTCFQPSAMMPNCALSARTSSDANGLTPLWRPWLFPSTNQCAQDQLASVESRPTVSACSSLDVDIGGKLCFQHPVRLFWPKYKSYDHLFSDGEALLKNFPVQATISFYDSESDSEDEDSCEAAGWSDGRGTWKDWKDSCLHN